MNKTNKEIYAVVAVIYHPKDKNLILGVSRKYDHTKMGLPGGKVDPGETTLEAAVRELKEETGLDSLEARSVYVGPCSTTKNGISMVECFEIKVDPLQTFSSTEEGLVRWCDWQKDMFGGPYAEYNKDLYSAINHG